MKVYYVTQNSDDPTLHSLCSTDLLLSCKCVGDWEGAGSVCCSQNYILCNLDFLGLPKVIPWSVQLRTSLVQFDLLRNIYTCTCSFDIKSDFASECVDSLLSIHDDS